jgi:hypothetical protein
VASLPGGRDLRQGEVGCDARREENALSSEEGAFGVTASRHGRIKRNNSRVSVGNRGLVPVRADRWVESLPAGKQLLVALIGWN